MCSVLRSFVYRFCEAFARARELFHVWRHPALRRTACFVPGRVPMYFIHHCSIRGIHPAALFPFVGFLGSASADLSPPMCLIRLGSDVSSALCACGAFLCALFVPHSPACGALSLFSMWGLSLQYRTYFFLGAQLTLSVTIPPLCPWASCLFLPFSWACIPSALHLPCRRLRHWQRWPRWPPASTRRSCVSFPAPSRR